MLHGPSRCAGLANRNSFSRHPKDDKIFSFGFPTTGKPFNHCQSNFRKMDHSSHAIHCVPNHELEKLMDLGSPLKNVSDVMKNPECVS
jgi:hypothetical protein